MHLPVILRITGVLLTVFSITLLIPSIIAYALGEAIVQEFFTAFVATLVAGLVMWLPLRRYRDLRAGDGFLVTALFYISLGLFGAIPLFIGLDGVGFTDATFESLSGLTTTGATVLTGLDDMPRSLLFYRQLLQWVGGMGIIVLAVAILPMLGIGGMQLYRAESPGPVKDTKLTPRITETAKALWYIYVSLTAACAFAYYVSGMSLFDAICHAFSTVAIGGFSTHDQSLAYFQSSAVEYVAIVFMLLAGINFGLHFTVLARRNVLYYFRDWEVRTYLFVVAVVAAVVIAILAAQSNDTPDAFRTGLFHAVSLATTTGFTTANFAEWPGAAPIILLLAAFAGGCAGSTAGGIKIIRVLLIYLQGWREVKRLIHPNGIFPIKIGRQPVPDRVIEAVWSFFAAYVIIFLLMVAIVMLLSPLDFKTAFSAVGACINNLGPGLGDVALNYQGLDASVKWVLIFAMLLGRLEIFTLLVLLTPAFWRR